MSNQRSIAVLPFQNLSSDRENDYFADGITEDIINALSKVERLKVTARTSSFSYKGTKTDVRIIGNDLGVSTVLDGSIRRAGNRVRISAQLVRTDNGFHIWSENFDRELKDIFRLQDEISVLIAEKIRENYGHLEIAGHLASSPTDNIDAYELYLKGRYNHLKWDWEGLQNGIRYYEESIAKDQSFALPLFGLSFCFSMIGSWGKRPELLDLSEEYISKGFAIDKDSDLGHFAKATLEFWGRWNFLEGEKSYRRAIALNHTNSEAMEGLAELYIAVGYFEEAEELTKEALKINPISANHLFTLGNIYYQQGDLEKGISYFNSGLRVDANFAHCISYKALALIGLGASDKLKIHLDAYPDRDDGEQCLALSKLYSGDRSPTLKKEVDRLLAITDDLGLIGWRLYLLAQSSEEDQALELLENAIEGKEGQYINFTHLPLLEPLRKSERFQELVDTTFAESLLPLKEPNNPIDSPAKKALLDDVEITAVDAKLREFMDEDKIYLNPNLTLRELAETIDLNANRLSWFLNDQLGKNFSEYINEKRVAKFKERAVSNDWSHLSILGLAYECGFNSKSVFNDFFKKSVGQTPSQWVKSHRD
ncbi:MAG: helix-turn-helix domain-containing protein [Cryomorphaceae bacterium]